jgi:glyoxylase-like metal-dependent hydrolase (beta-lactamase superfamily II)
MNRLLALGCLLVVGVVSLTATQQRSVVPAGPRVIGIEKLKDTLYVLTSSTPGNQATFSGGNVAVFITDGGVTLVDDKLAGWGQAVLDRVKSVTNKPITRIINTHTHGDHTGNNSFFGANVEIVAQENTKTNLTRMDAFKGENAKFLPGTTYKDKMSLGSGKDRIDLYYFGAGHTNGDTFVVFPALRVLHTGDMFAWKDGPLCDRNNGGSCVAFPQTLQKAIVEIKNVDTLIPGHSPMQTPKDLQEYQKFTAYLLAYSTDQMKAGKSAADAAAGFKLDQYQGYKSDRVQGAIQAVYDELKK